MQGLGYSYSNTGSSCVLILGTQLPGIQRESQVLAVTSPKMVLSIAPELLSHMPGVLAAHIPELCLGRLFEFSSHRTVSSLTEACDSCFFFTCYIIVCFILLLVA